uniref:Movement protein n=1 Tax=Digitaria ciliaris striate mosaic virus TaxID=1196237 RepID=J7FGE1_9GEMI|nr:movement protein [Digitaria ciliaris striate mosaic virus]
MAEYPQSAFVGGSAILRQGPVDSFASTLKVTALGLFATFIGAAVLSFLYRTCLSDCITQYRLGSWSSTVNSGFGGNRALPQVVRGDLERQVSVPVRDSGVLPVVSGAAAVGGG